MIIIIFFSDQFFKKRYKMPFTVISNRFSSIVKEKSGSKIVQRTFIQEELCEIYLLWSSAI